MEQIEPLLGSPTNKRPMRDHPRQRTDHNEVTPAATSGHSTDSIGQKMLLFGHLASKNGNFYTLPLFSFIHILLAALGVERALVIVFLQQQA